MKNKRKKTLAIGMMAALIAVNVTVASAETKTATINGISFSAYSKITKSGAISGTVSSSSGLTVSVTSKYSYINPNTLKTGSESKSQIDATAAASLSFNAPANCRSVKITSTNKAVSGGETWTATTSDTY